MMRSFCIRMLVLTALLNFAANASATSIEYLNNAIIDADVTWSQADTVFIYGKLVVFPTSTLSIAPGTVVCYSEVSGVEEYGIVCLGSIKAKGDGYRPIRFTRDGTLSDEQITAVRLVGGFVETLDTLLFDYCEFVDVGFGIEASIMSTGVFLVDHSTFTNALVGITASLNNSADFILCRSQFIAGNGTSYVQGVVVTVNGDGATPDTIHISNNVFFGNPLHRNMCGISLSKTVVDACVAQNSFNHCFSGVYVSSGSVNHQDLMALNNNFSNSTCGIASNGIPGHLSGTIIGNNFFAVDNDVAMPFEWQAIAADNHSWELPFAASSDYHLVYSQREGDKSADGINDGYAPDAAYRDPDGSFPDIGLYGGPDADPAEAYVVLENTGVGMEALSTNLEPATYLITDIFEVEGDSITVVDGGTTLLFTDTSYFLVNDDESSLYFAGTSSNPIVLKGINETQWPGLISQAGYLTLENTTIRDAKIGLQAVSRFERFHEGTTIENCGVGVLFNNVNHSTSNRMRSLKINECGTGLLVISGSVKLPGMTYGPFEISNCSGEGVLALSGASVILENVNIHDCGNHGATARNGSSLTANSCAISGCGEGKSGDAGITINGESQCYLKCNAITDNYGHGIYASSGIVLLGDSSSTAWLGGNEVSDNIGPYQIFVEGTAKLIVENGNNKVASLNSQVLILNNGVNAAELTGNYWGYASAEDSSVLRERLLPAALLPYFSFKTSWSNCETSKSITHSGCDSLLKTAFSDYWDGDFENAVESLKLLLRNYESCKYSREAAELILQLEVAAETDMSDVRDTLLVIKSELTDDVAKFALQKVASITAMLDGDYLTAWSELDSLSQATSLNYDSLVALSQLAVVEFYDSVSTTSDLLYIAAFVDSLMAHTSFLYGVHYAEFTLKPTLEWSDVAAVARAESGHEIVANAYATDDVPIYIMMVDYRYHPAGSWVHDTLEQQMNDTTWEITLPLGSLGGGLEYRLLAIDALGRVETWPGTEGYPNLNDTLTHFVSFEPRLTAPLADTAYVYAPGVITEDIEIADNGVLYILPAPVELDSYVVAIDSGVGISLGTSGGTMPKLFVEGTDSTVIWLECSDSEDLWAGVTSDGGYIEADHAEFRNSEQPLNCFKQYGYPVVRINEVAFKDFSLPLYFATMNSDAFDSSYVMNCSIENGDSSGVVISSGSLDFEDVTVQNCGDDGIVLQGATGQLFSNVTVKNNGRYGVVAETGACTARLLNCYVAFNGDTLPEIKVNSSSTIDVSDYSGNTVKDSTGVLFECEEVNDFDAELGSNSFVLADSTGKYFNVTSMSGPSYITGNTFFPETVNKTTFIDDFMKDDDLSKWVYSYLRAENQMENVIEDPSGSVDFELKAYVQNYLGTVASDTLTEVGFKYRLFPDSTNWTTQRQTTVETDSIYDWTISVGDQGGIISYIWWAKDAHGRYLTSPAGADTTTPDSGATHFLSFEMADTSIVNDSVTIWAPTTLTHDIYVGYGGRLVIKPWPGASDHTVTLAEGVSIYVYPSSCCNNPSVWIQGSESMPITIDAVDDTSEWEQIYINSGSLEATYTTFRSNMVAMEQGYQGTPVLKLDHCTFESSDGYFYIQSPDIADSYIRNCVFRDLGMTWDLGSFLILEGDIEITDSWFYNNTGNGITLGDAGATEISGCNIIANDLSGLESYGLVSSVTVSCSEFSYNGGDSVPEVYMWDGTFDFSSDAGNVFADNAGTLLDGPTMESFDLSEGGNGFYLFDSTGYYIVTGDQTDTMDITGNLWYPWTPDTSNFQDYFDPDTSRFWDWADPAEAIAACGVGGMSSLPGGQTTLVRPSQETYGISSHGGFASKTSASTGKTSKTVSMNVFTKQVSATDYTDAVLAQKSRQYAEAKDLFASYINQNPDHPKTEAALSRYMVAAKKSGKVDGLATFFERQESRTTNPRVKRAAKFLKLEAMAKDGRAQDALYAYDDIMRNPDSRHDSITAAIGATRILFAHKDKKMATTHPENTPASFTDMCRRIIRLMSSERRSNRVLDDQPSEAPIPTSYALHQNYPNPFNPSTEIRFDLPEAIRVELKIFNILGQEVVTLVDDVRAAGAFRVLWDGKNAGGLSVASGVYVYQIKTPNFTDAKKMVLIR